MPDETHLDTVARARQEFEAAVQHLFGEGLAALNGHHRPGGTGECEELVESTFDRLRTAILSSDPDVEWLIKEVKEIVDDPAHMRRFYALRAALDRIEARRQEVG